MAAYDCPPKPGAYKYIRLCEQLFYGGFDASHRDIATKEGIVKEIIHNLLSNPQDVGAGVFIVRRVEIRVSTNGSLTLAIPFAGLGADNDLKIFTGKSTAYGFKVSKM